LAGSQTVIDAGFLLKLFLPEEKSTEAHTLWSSWIDDAVEVTAPTLLMFEVGSVIRNKVHRRILTEEDATAVIDRLKRLDLSLFYDEDLFGRAWEIGARLKVPALYDCFYLSLSDFLDAPLWTADKRLYQTAKSAFPKLHLL
jgi:predicted nucleic acid-binding protein